MKRNLRCLSVAIAASAMLCTPIAQAQQNSAISSAERNDVDGTFTSITFSAGAALNPQQASQIFTQYFKAPDNTDVVLVHSTTTPLGVRTDRYVQRYKGIDVAFSSLTLVSKSNTVLYGTGNYYNVPTELPATPAVTEQTALGKAIKQVGARRYIWQGTAREAMLRRMTGRQDTSYYPKGTLVYVEDMLHSSDRKLHLAYAFNIYATEPLSRDMVYVDATNGAILAINALIENTSSNGTSMYSGNVAFQSMPSGSTYVLHDATRGSGINTYNCANGDGSTAYDFSSASPTFATNAALDAHWGAEKVYDYWLTQQGRNSYNNAGGTINSFVHYMTNYNNAFWDGYEMVYGDGSGIASGGFSPLVSLDVCAHEIGHAICQYTAGLAYNKESGAMNEGFSDIWAAVIENYANPYETDAVAKNKWAIGEEISASSLRRMDNPNIKGQPDTYGGAYWTSVTGCTPTSSNDYCGVHRNSGVLNYWFYLLTQGGSGTNDIGNAFAVAGVGITKAASIVYQTELSLTSTSTYANCRTASINAAISIYGSCSAEVEAVTRAWYAVGVGANYAATGVAAISGASSVCAGSATAMTNTTTGGVWSSSNAVVATVNTTGTVTGIAAGTATISYGSGMCYATKVVTVYASPAAISGVSSVCAGASAALSNSTTGGTWTSNNPAIATIASSTGIVTGLATGIVTITYAAPGGCTTARVITVNAAPTAITGTRTVCVDGTTTLASATTGGNWSSGNTAVANVSSSGVVSAVAPGTSVISYTTAGGCYTTAVVTVNAALVAGVLSGASSVTVGATTTIASSVSGGVWTSSNPAVAGVSSAGILTGNAAGVATITYTRSNSCGSAYAYKVMTVTPVATINTAPAFTNGASQSLAICRNTVASLNTRLAASDVNTGQTETWTIATPPAHGTLSGLSATALSTGGTVMPAGVSYTPVTGYSGNDVFAVRVSDGIASVVTTINVTVTAPPASAGTISGVASVAAGASAALTSSVAGGTWASSNAAVLPVSGAGMATGLVAGVATITYTMANGCGSAYATKTMTVTAPATTGNSAPIFRNGASQTLNTCRNTFAYINSQLSITDANVGQLERWTVVTPPAHGALGGLSTTATSNGGTVTPTGVLYSPATGYSGTDVFVVQVFDGFATAITTINVVITAPPASAGTISGPASVITGTSMALASSVAGGTWASSNSSVLAVSSTGSVTGITAGVATVTYKIVNGCGSVQVTKSVSVTAPPAIGVGGAVTISAYPNPTNGTFTLQGGGAGKLYLYSQQGYLVSEYRVEEDSRTFQLRSGLPAGVYIGKFVGDSGETGTVRIMYQP